MNQVLGAPCKFMFEINLFSATSLFLFSLQLTANNELQFHFLEDMGRRKEILLKISRMCKILRLYKCTL